MKKLKMFLDFVLSYFIDNYEYDYWHCPHPYSRKIKEGDYFIDFRCKINYPGPFDASGIPLLDLSSQHWAKKHLTVYSSVLVSQYALGYYSNALHGESRSGLSQVIKMADSLIENIYRFEQNNEFIAITKIDSGAGQTRSGMSQGQAISVWCRAFKMTGGKKYLDTAIEAFNAFKINIEDGGVINSSAGFPVIEEWINEPYQILNGHLFAFAGIIDLMNTVFGIEKFEKKEDIIKYYDLYLRSSLILLKKHDMFFWSKYSLKPGKIPNITSYFYHRLHIDMLTGLYIKTEIPEFKLYSDKWEKQIKNPFYKIVAMVIKLIDKC